MSDVTRRSFVGTRKRLETDLKDAHALVVTSSTEDVPDDSVVVTEEADDRYSGQPGRETESEWDQPCAREAVTQRQERDRSLPGEHPLREDLPAENCDEDSPEEFADEEQAEFKVSVR